MGLYHQFQTVITFANVIPFILIRVDNSLKFQTVIQNFCQNGFDEDDFVPYIPCSNSFLHLPNYTFFS